MDNFSYTFNGIGEFLLVDADDGAFVMQARSVLSNMTGETCRIEC